MDEDGGREAAGASTKDLQPLVLAITLAPLHMADSRRSLDKTKKDDAERRYLYTEERFVRNAVPDAGRSRVVARWRMRERMKTVSVALVYCLNIGVDPPDIVKPNPCARLVRVRYQRSTLMQLACTFPACSRHTLPSYTPADLPLISPHQSTTTYTQSRCTSVIPS